MPGEIGTILLECAGLSEGYTYGTMVSYYQVYCFRHQSSGQYADQVQVLEWSARHNMCNLASLLLAQASQDFSETPSLHPGRQRIPVAIPQAASFLQAGR